MQKISPFLWFEKDAGEIAKFYTSIFKGSKIKERTTLSDTPSGTVEIITLELLGLELTIMTAGPLFKFNESVSFVVPCETQDEIDYYWKRLSSDPKAEQCGWCKDKYGLSWQIVPTILTKMLQDKDAKRVARVTEALLKMKKFELDALKQAYEGK